ncbi:MAG: hypothetical protein H0T56_03950, partial [Pseudaminobacter sp.]|nr:hypothetical protein [Pseudaminobacter sp.]
MLALRRRSAHPEGALAQPDSVLMRKSLSRAAQCALVLTLSLFAAGSTLAQTCEEEVGISEAQIYVEQCIEVSPATRPPCNVENPCQLILDEIARSCAMLETDAPEFCGEYG